MRVWTPCGSVDCLWECGEFTVGHVTSAFEEWHQCEVATSYYCVLNCEPEGMKLLPVITAC